MPLTVLGLTLNVKYNMKADIEHPKKLKSAAEISGYFEDNQALKCGIIFVDLTYISASMC